MTNTFVGRRTAVALVPLRVFARWIGEGGILIAGAITIVCISLMDLDHVARNYVCIQAMGMTCLAIFARHQNAEGHRAMRRLGARRKKPQSDPFLQNGLKWLGLDSRADAAAVKLATKAKMFAHHPETGTGDIDMHDLVKFRDALIAAIDRRTKTGNVDGSVEISRVTKVLTYEQAAGLLGRTWGHLFPSDELKGIGYL